MDVRNWLRGFRYAYEGLRYALGTQRNMKFHFFLSFLVLMSAIVLQLPRTDILFLLLAITLVVVAELINTAIEKAVDLAMPDRHPVAKIAKDVSAAAVLVSAVFAVAVGMTVFYDPLDRLFHHLVRDERPISAGIVLVLLALVILSVVVIETRFSDRGRLTRPSLFAAVAFAVATTIVLIARDTLVFLLSFGLSSLVLIVLYDKKHRALASLVLGALIGVTVTCAAYYFAGRFFAG